MKLIRKILGKTQGICYGNSSTGDDSNRNLNFPLFCKHLKLKSCVFKFLIESKSDQIKCESREDP